MVPQINAIDRLGLGAFLNIEKEYFFGDINYLEDYARDLPPSMKPFTLNVYCRTYADLNMAQALEPMILGIIFKYILPKNIDDETYDRSHSQRNISSLECKTKNVDDNILGEKESEEKIIRTYEWFAERLDSLSLSINRICKKYDKFEKEFDAIMKRASKYE